MSVIPSTAPAAEETPVTPEVPVQDPASSRHFAALAKKERMIHKEREALKTERAAIELEKARIAELDAKYGNKPKSPREALTRYGFSYRDATDYELNDGQPTAEQIAREAQEEIKRFREEQAEAKKKATEEQATRSKAELEAVKQEFRVEIGEFINGAPEEYEMIKFHEAEEVVYHTVEEHYNRTGRLLSIPEAANLVENYLEKKLEVLKATKKFAKTRPGEPQQPQSGTSRQQEPSASTRTLDNSRSASTPTLITNPRVEDERMKRALAALG